MYLVVSASTHPEPQFMAAALSGAGYDVILATAASFCGDEWPMRLAGRFPTNALAAQVLRRRLPAGLSGQQVLRAGYLHEARHLWQRVGRGRMEQAARHRAARDRVFHRSVVSCVLERRPEVIIAQQNSAEPAFSAAGGSAFKVLGLPIAHHRWLKRELHHERVSNPEWADFIDPADVPEEAQLAVLDREIALADHIIVVSNFVRDTCIEFGVPAEKISVVHLASFPAPSHEAEAPAGLFAGDATLKVLFTGQLVQRKGISYLMEAFDGLAGTGAALTFVGGGSAEIVQRLTERPRVRVMPPMARSQLMAAQRAADVGVLPSLGEGFPLTAVETLAAGTPMIVSEATFARDVISDGVNGYVVPARDASALAEALRALAADPQLVRRMKEQAAHSVEHLTWDAYQVRFLEAFDAMGAASPLAPPTTGDAA